MKKEEQEDDMLGVITSLNKKHGSNAVFTLDTFEKPKLGRVSTGSISLDRATGGGLPYGRIVELYGGESSGKTSVSLETISNAQKDNKRAAFIDFEHALDTDYAESLGVDTRKLLISQPSTAESGLEMVNDIIDTKQVDLIVIDSVAAMCPEVELKGEMSDNTMGVVARLMNKALRKLTAKASQNDVLLIFINQTREKIGVMFGNPETTTGGNGLKFYASIRIKISKSQGDVKNELGEFTNTKIKADVIKNKTAPPFKKASYYIGFGTGIDNIRETIEMASEMGIINKAGSWYSYGDVKIGQGLDKVRDFLDDNEGMLEELNQKIRNNDLDV